MDISKHRKCIPVVSHTRSLISALHIAEESHCNLLYIISTTKLMESAAFPQCWALVLDGQRRKTKSENWTMNCTWTLFGSSVLLIYPLMNAGLKLPSSSYISQKSISIQNFIQNWTIYCLIKKKISLAFTKARNKFSNEVRSGNQTWLRAGRLVPDNNTAPNGPLVASHST